MTPKQTLKAVAAGIGIAALISTPVLVFRAASAGTTDRVDNEVKPASEALANSWVPQFVKN